MNRKQYSLWVILASLLYLISPIDLSPDLIPLLGQIDDVALIVLMVSAAGQWLTQQGLNGQAAANAREEDESVKNTVDVKAVEIDG